MKHFPASQFDKEHESVSQTLERNSAQIALLNQIIEQYEDLMIATANILQRATFGQGCNELAAEIHIAIGETDDSLGEFR